MSITEISQLSHTEKFQLMEALWSDLQPEIDNAAIPEEHKQLLDERRNSPAPLLDWDEVKFDLGK